MTLTRARVQQAAATIASLLLGFYLGIQYTGRLAYPPGAYVETPAWVGEVQTAGYVALAGFTAALLVAVYLDVQSTRAEATQG